MGIMRAQELRAELEGKPLMANKQVEAWVEWNVNFLRWRMLESGRMDLSGYVYHEHTGADGYDYPADDVSQEAVADGLRALGFKVWDYHTDNVGNGYWFSL